MPMQKAIHSCRGRLIVSDRTPEEEAELLQTYAQMAEQDAEPRPKSMREQLTELRQEIENLKAEK